MSKLRVSTIIPTYNRADMIERAVSSAIAQLHEGDEIIVVDDGSTDNTKEVLEKFGDQIVYISIKNSGAGAARNRGVAAARNELVTFLDSDDEWLPGKIELQRKLMTARPEILFCFTNFAVIDPSGRRISNYLDRWHDDKRGWDEILNPGKPYSQLTLTSCESSDFNVHIGDIYHALAGNIYVCTITVMVRREEAGEALWFLENIPLYEDWACYARLAGKGLGAYMNCETAINHGHTESRLTDADQYLSAVTRLTVLEEIWGSDPDFLSRHREYYEEIVEGQHLVKAAGLISMGKPLEARRELSLIKQPPLTYRTLTHLPRSVVGIILGLRRMINRLLS